MINKNITSAKRVFMLASEESMPAGPIGTNRSIVNFHFGLDRIESL